MIDVTVPGQLSRKIARGKPAEYDQEIVKRRFRLTSSLVPLENQVVLEFGCGNGAQTILTAGLCLSVIGLDIGLIDLQTFSAFLKQHQIKTILPVYYDGITFPLASDSVDVVTSYEVLEHVENEATVLREMHRVLRPEGDLIISVPNKGWIFETHGAYLPWLPWNRVPFFSWLPSMIHDKYAKARIYRKKTIIALLAAHSFQVVSTHYITAPMDVIKNARLKQWLRKFIFRRDTTRFTFLSTSILVHARKI